MVVVVGTGTSRGPALGCSFSGATAYITSWRTAATLGAAGARASTIRTVLVRASACARKNPPANSATAASPARTQIA